MRNKRFINICKRTQSELKGYLIQWLRNKKYKPIVGDGYIYAEGTVPILLTAHLDTVHKERVKEVWQTDNVISSPQGIGGDDRCGVYIILQALKKSKARPSVLFCEDEEIGGVGSKKFAKSNHIKKLEKMKYIIELDRKGSNDAVYYNCDNVEFVDWITDQTGYKEEYGSFSDISVLCPACKVAGVNLSCGYYNAHTTKEMVNMSEMAHTTETVVKLIEMDMKDIPAFEYIEAKYTYDRFSYGYDGWSRDWWKGTTNTTWSDGKMFYISWWDEQSDMILEDYIDGNTLYEALGKFFQVYPDVCFNNLIDYCEW